ncbi:fumarylacetoacetate hydrolase family protein [Novosphingobium pentaromativorans]|uniref:5-carboxymethyl-2-hydroxymuconate delta-isomerase n=1 Tax=Novosphingobium pentaromativorans US6-1 TaxID=1088721 RepID=G6EB75_9SPHN|nr:fumarylacetoacetate hydrolase family protein [Novosphingobium pentaromativorans]AIT80476.1 5-carboxymethyl-2-hydroxymuconate isomerase [Novosphingobium pentaromativorans US6-1]EHJ61434.1 5-carboxymethyl-2-hydroxymuconate delta-isomerase [Novosphingobium pentaromativorans US6-1]
MTFGLATIGTADGEQAVLVVGERIVRLTDHGEDRTVLALLDDWAAALPRLEEIARTAGDTGQLMDSVTMVAPHIPRQIFCTGANYRKHVIGLIMGDPSMRSRESEAMGEDERRADAERMMDERAKAALPYCFVKLSSCVVGPNDAVVLPRNVAKPDWELELGVVIGRRARHVTPETAMDYVAGFSVVNDVTAREHIFRRDNSAMGADWLSGKCFPTFLPFGPMIVPRQFVPDPYDLTIELSVNGKVYQNETTRDMMIGIERQIAYLSDRVELRPGDVICTGSPYGNGSAFGVFLQPGDVMEGTITGLGTQRNRCVAEEA